ncbi:MAG: hypothetical protein QOD45_1059 [Pseudonocardiales bacterium]|nr:hypothetical protein [Pseudonocardiales bacterium]
MAAPSLDYCSLIAADSAAFADAVEAGDRDAPVEHCPGWSLLDLARHLWGVQYFWAEIVARGLTDPDDVAALDETPHPPDDELIAALRPNSEWLVEILRAADPATPCWTWSTQHNVGFVQRHQVQEAAVHRWDAQNAAGAAQPIESAAALDAIEEFLTFSVSTNPAAAPDPPGEPLGAPLVLRATDATGVAGVPAGFTIADGNAPGTVQVSPGVAVTPAGARIVEDTASDVLLWLYQRVALTPTGPESAKDVVSRFRAVCWTD